jgi:hypothetical protein
MADEELVYDVTLACQVTVTVRTTTPPASFEALRAAALSLVDLAQLPARLQVSRVITPAEREGMGWK